MEKYSWGDTTNTVSSTIANTYRIEYGWECPRCGKINAPWARQCDCSRETDNRVTYQIQASDCKLDAFKDISDTATSIWNSLNNKIKEIK